MKLLSHMNCILKLYTFTPEVRHLRMPTFLLVLPKSTKLQHTNVSKVCCLPSTEKSHTGTIETRATTSDLFLL